ncbi:adenylate/guanylate cyclase domain-containing protein [Thalassobaculum sp.]|uniref:adenylate/guanylate cyclase domain-containing protein n=1 Tax=Thalassobaculum sp. TaxID=2022740 RepID=UPI0032ED9AA9
MPDAVHAAETIRALESDLIELALRRAPVDAIVERVAGALCEAGVQVNQIRLAARTLHPAIDAIAVSWSSKTGIDIGVFRHAEAGGDDWLRSPLRYMIDTRTLRMRRRLSDPAQRADYPVFENMAAAGITDYLAHLFIFGDPDATRRDGLIVRWMTHHADGFRDSDLAILDRIGARVAAAILPGLEHSIAGNLLEAYVGARSGAQVLEGTIQTGETQAMDAVIVVVDLAGFTAASDAVPGDRLVDLLDRHLEAMVPPMTAHGGEILAFLGDGFLAAFELGADARRACVSALDAATEAIDGVTALASTLSAEGLPALPLEAALHVGTVRYGNVGAGGRQAFTVIGPAVNAASRIEALCRPLGHRLLTSQAFAETSGDPRLRPVGDHPIRGIAEPMTLYALK